MAKQVPVLIGWEYTVLNKIDGSIPLNHVWYGMGKKYNRINNYSRKLSISSSIETKSIL